MTMLTQGRLLELVVYDPDTGVFTRRVRSSSRALAGDVAGSMAKNGYRYVYVDGVRYSEHRLAVLYMTGEWPLEQVDHRRPGKEFRSDNRWEQLRPATPRQNRHNQKLSSRNKSGYKGVWWDSRRQRWTAEIRVGETKRLLGRSVDFDRACALRQAAEVQCSEGTPQWR